MSEKKKKFDMGDFSSMSLQVAAVLDFAELLDYNYDRKANGPTLGSIALLLKTMLEPVEDFLSLAATSNTQADE